MFGLIFLINSLFANLIDIEDKRFYQRVLPVESVQILSIPDPISDEPTNLTLLKAFNKKEEPVGYIREVNTTTGCNSACLPVIFTLFYDQNKNYLKVLSKPGLTKKNHAPFTQEDYLKLEMILLSNPDIFNKVSHPKQMVDAISSETLKEYQPHVVKEAAYSSLRINLYNQQTLKFLKNLDSTQN